jgi:hypothetical protein
MLHPEVSAEIIVFSRLMVAGGLIALVAMAMRRR